MFEGQNTGFNTAFAERIAPRDRLPTAGELWYQRLFRSLDACTPEVARRHRELMFEIMSVLGSRETIVDGRWAPNPYYRDQVRYEELWDEIGDLLGIGPRPGGHGTIGDDRQVAR